MQASLNTTYSPVSTGLLICGAASEERWGVRESRATAHDVLHYKGLAEKKENNKYIKKVSGQGRANPDIEHVALHIVLLNIKSSILDRLISRTGRCEPFCQLDCSGLTLNCTPTAAALSLRAGEAVASSRVYLRNRWEMSSRLPRYNNIRERTQNRSQPHI